MTVVARYQYYCYYLLSVLVLNLYSCGPLELQYGTVALRNYNQTSRINLAIHQCKSKYLLVGDTLRYCTEGGKWSGVDAKCSK